MNVLSPVGLMYNLEGLLFNIEDDEGVIWFANLDGWDEMPDPIGEVVPRPNDDGADFADLVLGPKPLTLNGSIICPDQATAYRCRDRLTTAAQLLRRTGQLIVTEPIAKRVEVRLGGGLIWTWVDGRAATFSVPLTAADPRKYAADESTANVQLADPNQIVRAYPRVYDGGLRYRVTVVGAGLPASLTNEGVTPTYPTFTVRGPVTNPVIELVGTGKFIEFTVTLTGTDVLTIDTATRSVLLNGSPSRWLLTDGGFFQIPPGDSQIAFRAFTFNTQARLDIAYRSAWL